MNTKETSNLAFSPARPWKWKENTRRAPEGSVSPDSTDYGGTVDAREYAIDNNYCGPSIHRGSQAVFSRSGSDDRVSG